MYVNIIHLVNVHREKMTKKDVFIGYHADTCASIILYICHEIYGENYKDSNSNSNNSDEEDKKTKVCNLTNTN